MTITSEADLANEAATQGATGIPAAGTLDRGNRDTLGGAGMHHWRQSTILDASLDRRDNIFFAAIEMTRMPMVLVDPHQPDMPLVFINNAFLDLTGYEEHEIIGRNCRFLQGPQTDTMAVRQLRQAIERREAIALEILNYRRDGTPFWNGVFMGPVFGPEGELLYFFASQLDVSPRREADQQFRQAQKMEAIGQLTAGLAHDFNNLLHVINGSLERLQTKRHDDRMFARYHTAATQAAERGAKLTHQLLAFARRGRLEPKGVDLGALVGDIADLLESSAGSKNRLSLNLQRRLPLVKVDTNHLEMALLNIVVNARDASPAGGTVTVTTRDIDLDDDAEARGLAPGNYVLVSVADQGEGMPPHVLARATEPFFTTKPRGAGTGLGLAMAHGFVQQSGGKLEIESTPGQGTTITLVFPRYVVDGVEHDAEHPAEAGYQTQPLDPAAPVPRILVVDDNREAAGLAAEILREVGYQVLTTHSAEEAIQHFDAAAEKGHGFDLVFSDVIMPGGANGLELAHWVQGRMPPVPVLLTTGYNDEMVLNGPQAHAMDVLGKPFRQSELIDRVQAALRNGTRIGPGRQTSDFGHVQA